MIFVPRNASDEQVLDIVREWIDVLTKEDYEAVFAAVGYSLSFGEPGAECIRKEIKKYRSPEYFLGVEEFTVTDWRTAHGGNPTPAQKVTWYKPNSTRLAGAVVFDLPLNGQWSDLTADFVFFENDNVDEGYVLCLEEIGSWTQTQREMEASEAAPPA
jgi:hypothetical protein